MSLFNPDNCGNYIAIVSEEIDTLGIGLPFLREVYFVKDLEANTIVIAPVKHTNESDIVDFWF